MPVSRNRKHCIVGLWTIRGVFSCHVMCVAWVSVVVCKCFMHAAKREGDISHLGLGGVGFSQIEFGQRSPIYEEACRTNKVSKS